MSGLLENLGPLLNIAALVPGPQQPFLFAAAIAVNVASAALNKPKKQSTDFASQSQRVSTLVRSSIEPRKVVYGEAKISGPLVMVDVPGPANGNFFGVVALQHTRAEEIGQVWLNDALATLRASDGAAYYKANITDGPFSVYGGTAGTGIGLYSLYKHTGNDDQAADDILMAQVSDGRWTANHRLRGIAYLGARILSDPGTWAGGLPNLSAEVRGRRCWDPRTTAIDIVDSSPGSPAVFTTDGAHGLAAGDRVFIQDHADAVPAIEKEFQVATVPSSTTFTLLSYGDAFDEWGETVALTTGGAGGTAHKMLWTDNAALCALDYLMAHFGFNCDAEEIDQTAWIAAANLCDEFVSLTETAAVFTADASTDICNRGIDPDSSPGYVPIRRGDRVQVSTTDTLPGGLSAATNYYYIPQPATVETSGDNAGRPSSLNFKLATSLANARAGTAIDITSAGSGTHTVTRKAQPRYCANGFVVLDQPPLENLSRLLSACASIASYVQGEWEIAGGAFSTPTSVDLDENDLRGPISLQRSLARKDLFNTVRGTFVDPDDAWQPKDFPAITSDVFKAADGGEEIARDIELPFENDITRAQRLAKIVLLRARTGGFRLEAQCNIRALRFAAGETMQVSFGSGLATLQLTNDNFEVSRLNFGGDESGFGVDLSLSAVAASDYSWSAGEADAPSAPRTLKTIDTTFAQPPGLMLSQDTIETAAADTVPRLIVTLSPPSDQFVVGFEAQYRESGSSAWVSLGSGGTNVFRTTAVEFGETYEVRGRTINAAQAPSDWAEGEIMIDPVPTGVTLWDAEPGNIDTWGNIDAI